MGNFFKPSKDLEDFLVENGFENSATVPGGRLKYFRNGGNKQFKINYNDYTIVMMDKFGNVVEKDTSFTKNEIQDFINN